METPTKFFLVGGAVRDELMGLRSKDLDYSCESESFDTMRAAVIARGGTIFVETPKFFTIRAKVPNLGDADFVLARKDCDYSDGRRPDSVIAGTLQDDLARRDFTVNAIAKAEDGSIIDPFNGQTDLAARVLRCVGQTEKRMSEDSLRMLRAIRFSITKGFALAPELEAFLQVQSSADLLERVSIERVREELLKCFAFNTLQTLQVLEKFWRIRSHIFSRNLKIVPTIIG